MSAMEKFAGFCSRGGSVLVVCGVVGIYLHPPRSFIFVAALGAGLVLIMAGIVLHRRIRQAEATHVKINWADVREDDVQ